MSICKDMTEINCPCSILGRARVLIWVLELAVKKIGVYFSKG